MNKLAREEIAKLLDITDPFLMIDQFEIIEQGKQALATKILGKDDWYFQSHLPKSQVMPATLQIEGMLQTLVLLIYKSIEHGEHRAFINDIQVKLLAPVTPKSNIDYHATLLSTRRGITKGEVIGRSDAKMVCKGEFAYASPHLMALPVKAR